MFPRFARPDYTFFLVNRARGDAVAGHEFTAGTFFIFPGLDPIRMLAETSSGVRVAQASVTFRGSRGLSDEITSAWLEDAPLVVVRTTREGAALVPLVIEDLRWGLERHD